ncbi:threonine synthase [Fulvivirga sedimenti]|uniref:Threonine synthase n=1 Tax=Fulvivirga sedimenti TaxID=2879465 RepID=A0A9X1HXE9_9BACT|nr:threonine synthase [Fulvivirga sedimenti]MCA6078224.1 threonine synthase [Fulvivirga sedimenti]
MKFYSTNNKDYRVSFRDAVVEGLPSDNGLFFPESIPGLSSEFLNNLKSYSLPEIGREVMSPYTEEDIPSDILMSILEETLNFEIPLVPVDANIMALELFHGPTMAFKDVGARFLARCLGYFAVAADQKVTVLVATSGDTGSAVGHGFLNVPNVDVVILYPSGKVSPLQEKQLTTLGNNITALEIAGNFDDCQAMVKKAFLDNGLRRKMHLTSANSINVARWLPQSVYYFWAAAQVQEGKKLIISVPSGNYGNLTAGLLAKKMGLPIEHFIAASNANRIIPDYLQTGNFKPAPSIATLSNAMDVGNPSNFPRLLEVYNKEFKNIKSQISGASFSDEDISNIIRDVYQSSGYLLDPHGAIGYLALLNFEFGYNEVGIFLETAHPGKFDEVMNHILDFQISLPERLNERINMKKQAIQLPVEYAAFHDWLIK